MHSPYATATRNTRQSQAFVPDHRNVSSVQHHSALFSMPNIFPACDHEFIRTLAEDLNLLATGDTYDEHDREHGDREGEWKYIDDGDEDDGEERNTDVNRVLKKYDKAKVIWRAEGLMSGTIDC